MSFSAVAAENFQFLWFLGGGGWKFKFSSLCRRWRLKTGWVSATAARKIFKIFQSSAAAAQPLDLHLYLYAFTTFLPFFFFYLLSKQETRNRIAWPLFSSCVKKKKRKKKK